MYNVQCNTIQLNLLLLSGSCDFEEGICGWRPDDVNQLTWNRDEGGSDYSFGFGPDHTNNGAKPGWFMKMDIWNT